MKITQICNNLFQVEMNDLFYLQSYDTVIALYNRANDKLILSEKWNFSKTTKNHLFKWLSNTAPEIFSKLSDYKSKSIGIENLIASGEIKLKESIDS